MGAKYGRIKENKAFSIHKGRIGKNNKVLSKMETKKTNIADTILKFLSEKLEKKEIQMDTRFWLEIGTKLNISLIEENQKLADLFQKVAKLKLMWLDAQDKKNVSEAKLRVEASDEYKEWKIQDLKCKQIEEFIRLSKKMSDREAGF